MITGIIVIPQLGSTGFVEVLGHALILFLPPMPWFPLSSRFPSGFKRLSASSIGASFSVFLGYCGRINQEAEKGKQDNDGLDGSHVVGVMGKTARRSEGGKKERALCTNGSCYSWWIRRGKGLVVEGYAP